MRTPPALCNRQRAPGESDVALAISLCYRPE
ncbi:Hypothetical Protein XCAW_01465 [Xanthomonas citri subsp. citri Aw12879]|nr:Hypothetical Protein XCAW_01465 [Xanthomonas citri subsp. citri Aw12879]